MWDLQKVLRIASEARSNFPADDLEIIQIIGYSTDFTILRPPLTANTKELQRLYADTSGIF